MASDACEIAVSFVQRFCESRVPAELRHEMRVECSRRGNTITITERRAPWNPELIGPDWTSIKVAELRLDPRAGRWSLYCSDSNGRWWAYDTVAPSTSVEPLLAEIAADGTGIFWG